jgi:hypothetical protein
MTPIGGYSATGVADPAASAPAAAALLAQLQRLQQQLSECVNCADGKTPQGKANADAIRGRISQLEARIAHSDQVAERRTANLQAGKVEPAASLAAATGTVSQPAKTSGMGQIVDVFA